MAMINQIEIPEFHLCAKLYIVSYLSEGLMVKGYLAVPNGNGPFPLLIYCRGGIRNVGMTKLAWVNEFVSVGFMVFAPFYRGNRGGEGREDFGGADRHDVIDAINWLRMHPLVDKTNIHIFGFSRGAIPALFTSMHDPAIASAVVWGGVSDLVLTYEERADMRRMLKRVVGGSPSKVPEGYAWRSPIHYAEQMTCPVLIIHGARDRQVGVEHAYRLSSRLEYCQKQSDLWIYEEEGHHFRVAAQGRTMKKMMEWMLNQTRS